MNEENDVENQNVVQPAFFQCQMSQTEMPLYTNGNSKKYHLCAVTAENNCPKIISR